MENPLDRKCLFCEEEMEYKETQIIYDGEKIIQKAMHCNNNCCDIQPIILSEETEELMLEIEANNIGCTIDELRESLNSAILFSETKQD